MGVKKNARMMPGDLVKRLRAFLIRPTFIVFHILCFWHPFFAGYKQKYGQWQEDNQDAKQCLKPDYVMSSIFTPSPAFAPLPFPPSAAKPRSWLLSKDLGSLFGGVSSQKIIRGVAKIATPRSGFHHISQLSCRTPRQCQPCGWRSPIHCRTM